MLLQDKPVKIDTDLFSVFVKESLLCINIFLITAFSVAWCKNHTECPFLKQDYPHLSKSRQHLKQLIVLNRSYKLENSFNFFLIYVSLSPAHGSFNLSIYIYLFISMYNKKSSVFFTLYKKVVPVLFSLCILLHDFMGKGQRGVGQRWMGARDLGKVWEPFRGPFKSEFPVPSPWCEFL